MASYKYNQNNFCLECHEEIFNPLCPVCLSGEIRQWLKDKSSKVKSVVNTEIKRMLTLARYDDYTKCVSCMRNKTFMCPYCFTERIYSKLKEKGIDKKILMEFLEIFNFDLEHTGYSRDMDKFGML